MQGEGSGQSLFGGDRTSVWEGEKIPETDGEDGCTTV